MKLPDLKIRYAGVTCKDCGCLFGVPTLGDFNYGEFILHCRGVALSMRPVCPHCQSRDVGYNGSTGTFHRVPQVQYTDYLALGESARDERVARLWLVAGTRSGTIC
jgi:hypothetical protein